MAHAMMVFSPKEKMAGPGTGKPRLSSFEDEYVRTIEAKYCINILQKCDSSSAAWAKLKPGKQETVSCEIPIVTHINNERNMLEKLSPVRKIVPNGKHPLCTEKVTRSSKLIKNCKRKPENNHISSSQLEGKLSDQKVSSYVPKVSQVTKTRKRKSEGKVEVTSKMKRRKRQLLDSILDHTTDCSEQVLDPLLNGNTDASKNSLHDLRHYVSMKKAAKLTGGICNTVQTLSKIGTSRCENGEVDKKAIVTGVNFSCEDGCLGVNSKPKDVKSDLNTNFEKFNNNLNEIPVHSNEEHLKKLFERKLSEAVKMKDTVFDLNQLSPFKGKLSAFEISVMKGKQNLERRKSIESATLRSSPRRRNGNVPRPNYREKQHYKNRHSLDSALEQIKPKNKSFDDKGSKRQDNRTLTSDSYHTLPLHENHCKRSQKKKLAKKSLKVKWLQSQNHKKVNLLSFHEDERTDECPFAHRMNGSPKLGKLPLKLSFDKLPGPADQIQRGMYSSIHKDVCANAKPDSGTIQPFDSSTLNMDAKKSSFTLKTLPHAVSLAAPVSEPLNSQKTALFNCANNNSDTQTKKTKCAAQCKKEIVARVKRKKMLLQETENMLGNASFKAVRKPDEARPSKPSLSPETSETRSSRSSLSLTPTGSPMKSEILTPSSTPSSSPSKASTDTPVVGAKVKVKRPVGTKKGYLFSKGDEVLTRWHDGLFYLGKILKINEEHHKCLLRYEDNSQYWSLFKDIHRVLKEEEIVCCVCLNDDSDPPNEIVLCEYCLQGYHQQCHIPCIGSGKIEDPDEPWFCRKCVFLRSVKVGGALKTEKWGEELKKMKCVLPYKLDDLNWDLQHKNNTDQSYCYCGGPGIWYQKMLQCCRCKQWFHEACMQCLEFSLLFADSFYIFVCAPCNMGTEYNKRLDVEWPDLIHIGLFNLAMLCKRKYFDFHTDLLPWLQENWDQLQVKQYENLSLEEKEKQIQNALETNTSRFANGSEIHKKHTLWGLRVRVAPPRIHIKLPVNGKVTDEVMNKLKIKGRRSKVFMPVECTSPIQHIQHSPLNVGVKVRKWLDKDFAAEPADNCSPSIVPSSATCTQKSKRYVPLLDQLIPPDDDYTGAFHPFKTDIEQNLEKLDLEVRSKIWKHLEAMHDESNDVAEDYCGHKEDFLLDDPPILEKVEPVEPSENSHGTPPMPEIKEKTEKIGRSKSISKSENSLDLCKGKRRSSRKPCLRHNPLPDDADNSNNVKEEITVKNVKTVSGNYFCAYNKTQGYMKGFSVFGKNVTADGDVEYLVHWN